MAQRGKRNALDYDPRTKLLFVLATGIFTFMAPDNFVLIWCFIVVLGILLIDGYYRQAIMNGIFYMLVLGLGTIITRYVANGILQIVLGMFLFMTGRLFPIYVIAGWAINNTETSELITAMQKMYIPKGFTIPLAVTFRFVPTVRYEFRYIKNTMKLRGVGITWKNLLKVPVNTLEYALVPLLLRSIKIADDLAASALTRGLDRDTPRTSLREVGLHLRDYAGLIIFTGTILVGFFLYDYV